MRSFEKVDKKYDEEGYVVVKLCVDFGWLCLNGSLLEVSSSSGLQWYCTLMNFIDVLHSFFFNLSLCLFSIIKTKPSYCEWCSSWFILFSQWLYMFHMYQAPPPSGWQVSHRGPIKCLHPVVAVCLCVLTCTKSGIMIPGMAVLKGFARVKCEHLYANWIVSRLDVSPRRSLLSCFSVYRSVMFISQKELHIISKLYLALCWDPHFVFLPLWRNETFIFLAEWRKADESKNRHTQ